MKEDKETSGWASSPVEIIMQTGQIVTHEMIDKLHKHFEEKLLSTRAQAREETLKESTEEIRKQVKYCHQDNFLFVDNECKKCHKNHYRNVGLADAMLALSALSKKDQ